MIFIKAIFAHGVALKEEFEVGKSFLKVLLMLVRVLLFFGTIIFFGLILMITLLAENEGSNVEVMSLYISLMYVFFLIANFLIPWKILSINKWMRNGYLFVISFSFLVFVILEILSLYFHEGGLFLKALSNVMEVFYVLFCLLVCLVVLFVLHFKLYYPSQRNKSFKSEWKRLIDKSS